MLIVGSLLVLSKQSTTELAEGVGFEPTIHLHGNRISSAAP